MCQLFGMNSRTPASVQFSLTGFVRRGGETDHHADGWGIAFFDGPACRLFTDSLPAVESPVAELVCRHPFKSRNVIAHVRKATHGPVALANCHPFVRELWGRHWSFAHNGRLDDFEPLLMGYFSPMGETDSELAFCYILQCLRERFGSTAPELKQLRAAVAALAAEISAHGPFNFLLSDGDVLLAHCSTELHALQRQAPFGRVRLVDCQASIDLSLHNREDDCMALLATRPLTQDEAWRPLAEGELLVFRHGAECAA